MQILQNTPVPHFYKFGKRIKVLNMQIKAGVSQYLHNITNMYFYNILHIIWRLSQPGMSMYYDRGPSSLKSIPYRIRYYTLGLY